MKARAYKKNSTRNDTACLFDDASGEQKVERPFAAPSVLLGTSAFTADGWQGTFYPPGTKSGERLKYYSTQFQTVEIDSTFYGTPSAATVKAWYEKTPTDFIFAAKVPQVITHEKVLVDCEAEWESFLATMDILAEKLGPLLFQFGKFKQGAFKTGNAFLARLTPFLKKLPKDRRFAVEIRNKDWLNADFVDTLREHNVALTLIDQSWMPRPWEMTNRLDLITSDFTYVRWLGDRKGIEEVTRTWDKTVIDRREDLTNWVEVFRHFLSRNLKVFAYANNHYAGHGPATVKLFWDLFEKR
ncbi:MAG: DUF72 domain-containing protein [Acidobacteriota bacterium]|nr:DUF72 domain-containing protein [Acidobacteriota bacterium]